MTVKNITKNTIVSNDLKIAASFLDRLSGLINKNSPSSFLCKTRFGIHTFFLSEPIDVLVLDRNGNIIITKIVKPNRIFIYNPKYRMIVELPEKSIQRSKSETGDAINIY